MAWSRDGAGGIGTADAAPGARAAIDPGVAHDGGVDCDSRNAGFAAADRQSVVAKAGVVSRHTVGRILLPVPLLAWSIALRICRDRGPGRYCGRAQRYNRGL